MHVLCSPRGSLRSPQPPSKARHVRNYSAYRLVVLKSLTRTDIQLLGEASSNVYAQQNLIRSGETALIDFASWVYLSESNVKTLRYPARAFGSPCGQ